ncbi:septum site-determining protein MinC [Marinobacter sp.]|uniref:septum site-determining protein MinC n=1 Tax=Marinobacter sp. TaxID=50741 RepID=UPI00384D2DC0
MTETATTGAQQSFQLKGATVPMTALELHYFDTDAFENNLREKIRQAPGFFRDIPLIISLEKYQGADTDLDFFQIIGICRRHSIQVVGVRGGNEDQNRLARNASLALLPSASNRERPAPVADDITVTTEPSEPAPAVSPTPANGPVAARIITQPVRSGQQVYAPEGDLVVLASVQPGAEVLAAGNIHVYGPLRGRALAGVHGLESARIFCQSLEAELVSIAGHYKISEDLQGQGWKSPVQIQLREDLLVVTPLDRV